MLRLLVVWCLFFAPNVFAACTQTYLIYAGSALPIRRPGYAVEDLSAACTALNPIYLAANTPVYGLTTDTATGAPGARSYCGYWSGSNFITLNTVPVHSNRAFVTPAGTTVWTNTDPACTAPVTCPEGQSPDPDTGACSCDSGKSVGGQMITGDGYKGCKGGCSVLLQSGWYDKTANTTWGYNWTQTGSACTASDVPVLSPTDPKVTDAQKCPVGQCPGTVNGQSVCVACAAPKEAGTTKDTTKEVSTPASGASSVSSSSSSGTSTTKCVGDQCTTTTTTTTVNPDGSKSDKTSTKDQPKSDFCADNPTSSICKEGNWGGTCASGFTCDGDAVQCAQAKAAYELKCALTEKDDDSIGKYNTLKSEGLAGLSIPGVNIEPPAVEAFGTCPLNDFNFDLGFGPIAFQLSQVCPYLEVIHRVVSSFGVLFWIMIVFVR